MALCLSLFVIACIALHCIAYMPCCWELEYHCDTQRHVLQTPSAFRKATRVEWSPQPFTAVLCPKIPRQSACTTPYHLPCPVVSLSLISNSLSHIAVLIDGHPNKHFIHPPFSFFSSCQPQQWFWDHIFVFLPWLIFLAITEGKCVGSLS